MSASARPVKRQLTQKNFAFLFNPWTQIPLLTLQKEKKKSDYLSLLIKSNRS